MLDFLNFAGGDISVLRVRDTAMVNPNVGAKSIIESFPQELSLDDALRRLYFLERVEGSIKRAETNGMLSRKAAKTRLGH